MRLEVWQGYDGCASRRGGLLGVSANDVPSRHSDVTAVHHAIGFSSNDQLSRSWEERLQYATMEQRHL